MVSMIQDGSSSSSSSSLWLRRLMSCRRGRRCHRWNKPSKSKRMAVVMTLALLPFLALIATYMVMYSPQTHIVVEVNETTAVATAVAPATADQHTQERLPSRRSLDIFRDVKIGEYIGKGDINVACYVELPDWWWQQQQQEQQPKKQLKHKMMMKMSGDVEDAQVEIDAWELLNKDKAKAQRLNILPLIAFNKNVSNPFFNYGKKKKKKVLGIPESFPMKVRKYLRTQQYMAVTILPFADSKGYVHDDKIFDNNIHNVKYFMRSLLSQLQYAHSLGVNCLDLSGSREAKGNVLVSRDDGGAILFDWTDWTEIGERLYYRKLNFDIVPPEGWLEKIPDDGRIFKMTSISAWDVWSVGVMFARLLYKPYCRWATHRTYNSQYYHGHKTYSRSSTINRLRETILAIGGNTVVPVNIKNKNNTVDLAEIVGLNDNSAVVLGDVKFRPHLVNMDGKFDSACSAISKSSSSSKSPSKFKFWESLTEDDKIQALDFLKSMMKISPSDRPDCGTLLRHPFLLSSSTNK